MGQVLRGLLELELEPWRLAGQQQQPCPGPRSNHNSQDCSGTKQKKTKHYDRKFPDLLELPPELSLAVLSYLNATDLCLAACVWRGLAEDEILWQGLCREQWGYATIYTTCHQGDIKNISFRRIYLQLDEGTLTFNADAFMGMDYFFKSGILVDDPGEIAQFLHHTHLVNKEQLRIYLDARRDVLDCLIKLHNYQNKFLPNALRDFFLNIQAPSDRGNYLHTLLEKFSARFCQCNPNLNLSSETVYILCFSLILLSVDLCSPQVKNKMSKREFIRNVRHAIQRPDDDMAGHLYDNVYLRGHIVPFGAAR